MGVRLAQKMMISVSPSSRFLVFFCLFVSFFSAFLIAFTLEILGKALIREASALEQRKSEGLTHPAAAEKEEDALSAPFDFRLTRQLTCSSQSAQWHVLYSMTQPLPK